MIFKKIHKKIILDSSQIFDNEAFNHIGKDAKLGIRKSID